MAKNETSILIHRPIEPVFAYVTNPANLPHWAARTYDVTMTSTGPVTVGTNFLAVGHFLNQRIESPQEVIEFEPKRCYAVRSRSGPIAFVFRYTFEPVSASTRIVFVGDVQAGVFFKLAEPIFASAVARLCETDLRRLKTVLEATSNK